MHAPNPFLGRPSTLAAAIEGQSNDANHRVISADYFRTIGVRLRAGRLFRDSDGPEAPPVAIVNQAMARQYWPGQNPLGHRIQLGSVAGVWFTVVGVVDDVRQAALDENGRAEMCFPYTQPAGTQGYLTPRDLAVRVKGDPWRMPGHWKARSGKSTAISRSRM